MNYKDPRTGLVRVVPHMLGMTIMRNDATVPEAAQIGMVEGISNVTRVLTIALAVTVAYMLIPRRITSRVEERIKGAL